MSRPSHLLLYASCCVLESPQAVRELLRLGVCKVKCNTRTLARAPISPVQLAVFEGNEEIVRLFFEHRAQHVAQSRASLPINTGASKDDNCAACAVRLPWQTVISDSVFYRSFSLIHYAALYGRANILRFLLDGDGKKHVDARYYSRGALLGDPQFTLLYLAVKESHLEAVRTLLELGADVNTDINMAHSTLLHAAASYQAAAYETIYDELHSWHVHTQRFNNLDCDACQNIRSAPWKRHCRDAEIVRMLIAHGANVGAKIKNGWQQGNTAFHVACLDSDRPKGFTKVMEALLELGADLGERNIYGQTPVMLAVRTGDSSFARRMFRHITPENAELLWEIHGVAVSGEIDKIVDAKLEKLSRNPRHASRRKATGKPKAR